MTPAIQGHYLALEEVWHTAASANDKEIRDTEISFNFYYGELNK